MIRNICALMSLLLFCNCSKNDKLSDNDLIIIEKIIEELSGKEKIYRSTTYLVNPYIDSFGFHPYFLENGLSSYMEEKKNETFDALDINEEEFETIKDKVNSRYQEDIYNELLDLSLIHI